MSGGIADVVVGESDRRRPSARLRKCRVTGTRSLRPRAAGTSSKRLPSAKFADGARGESPDISGLEGGRPMLSKHPPAQLKLLRLVFQHEDGFAERARSGNFGASFARLFGISGQFG